jgi:hypothetical protein
VEEADRGPAHAELPLGGHAPYLSSHATISRPP